MRILIADDHAVVRRGLKQILAEDFKKAEFGEAGNSREALERIRKENWDAVVLDITMPGRSGLEILKEVKEAKPRLPVLVLSMHPEDQFAVRVLKSGASGYMTKEARRRSWWAPSERFSPADIMSARRWPKKWPPIWRSIHPTRRTSACRTVNSPSCA